MAANSKSTSPQPANMHNTVITGFRLGEDDVSDASDSDQSAPSERSLSPTPQDDATSTAAMSKKSRSKKRRELKAERKQVNALTDDLDSLLGDAFQDNSAKSASTVQCSGTAEQAADEQTMEVDAETNGKKMSKRTRQNLAKILKRKAHHEHQAKPQIAAADRRNMSLDAYLSQKSQNRKRKSVAQARKEKKERQKAKKAAAKEDTMDIG